MTMDVPPKPALKILSPTSDVILKRLFDFQERKQNLIDFANAVMFEGKPIIRDVDYPNTKLNPVRRNGKVCRLNVKAKTNTGEFLDVEIQLKHRARLL
jgi:hypothetical protein